MTVVDSSVWIRYFSNCDSSPALERLDALLSEEIIVVGDLILAEVLQGFRSDKDHRTAKSLLTSLEYRDMMGRTVAIESAEHHRLLRKRGITIRKTIDSLIATFCIIHNLPLLHDDQDFLPFEQHLGLRSAL